MKISSNMKSENRMKVHKFKNKHWQVDIMKMPQMSLNGKIGIAKLIVRLIVLVLILWIPALSIILLAGELLRTTYKKTKDIPVITIKKKK